MAIYREMYDGPPLHYGARATVKRVIAIHNTSNDATRQGEASYAKRRTDSVSSHYYADSTGVTQSLDTDLRAYHAGSTTGNDVGISYEITGVNGWTRQQWLDRVHWPSLAAAIARDCRHHGIGVRLLTVAQMRDGHSTGVVTHDLMRLAWGGTTHTDPGSNFPMDHLLALVSAQLNGGNTAMADDYGNFGKPPAVGDRTTPVLLADVWREVREGTGAYSKTSPARGGVIARLDRIETVVTALAERETPTPVTITDEQLERVVRKVLGMAPAS